MPGKSDVSGVLPEFCGSLRNRYASAKFTGDAGCGGKWKVDKVDAKVDKSGKKQVLLPEARVQVPQCVFF